MNNDKDDLQLAEEHRAYLKQSVGASDRTLNSGVACSVTDQDTAEGLVGKRPYSLVPAIGFRQHDGSVVLRPDKPHYPTRKYEVPTSGGQPFFLHERVWPLLGDPHAEITICEGGKKAWVANEAGFAAIGMNGIYGMHNVEVRKSDSSRWVADRTAVRAPFGVIGLRVGFVRNQARQLAGYPAG